MKHFFIFLIIISLGCNKSSHKDEYTIRQSNGDLTLFISPNSDEIIKWAVNDLAEDISEMLDINVNVELQKHYDPSPGGIYVGQFGDPLTQSFPDQVKLDLSDQWEKFTIQKLNDQQLFVIGSDIRGTVFGIFDLAERIGISPWKWWADVRPEKAESISITLDQNGITESPSIKYRGIFLNDEDWGLQPWAAKTFEPETGDIGPKTYEKIFQLLLRLKANTIWPAMHPSTKAFFTIPGNKEMAEKYHIFIATSHAEPMLRNNVDEWDHEALGDYNYFTNSDVVKSYWNERISETTGLNSIITLGMRGIHDSGMEGNASQKEKVELLEGIISDQRMILGNNYQKSPESIPQVFTVYKEVLDLYNSGLSIPEDVILMWTDDNYGYIRRLSNEEEQKRHGGSGVYYHLSYWGRPHDYLWLSSTQPGLIWYEMTRAYQNGADQIWIANVGDIKPAEYNMEFFLDLAWDINSITEETIHKHLTDWGKREFGESNANEIAEIFNEYYRLAFLRKPEFMGWSQVERITPTRISEFTNEEAKRRINNYNDLVDKVEQIKSNLDESKLDAFFQLVEYPVKGAALMNQKFLYAQLAAMESDPSDKNQIYSKALNAFKQIDSLTNIYNHEISQGKWKSMMDWQPRKLPVYEMPDFSSEDGPEKDKDDSVNGKETVPVFIQANDFKNAQGSEKYEWEIVQGLGYSNNAVTLFPFDHHYFKTDLPYLLYTFEANTSDSLMIEIRILPTHSNNFDQILTVQYNEGTEFEYPLNTKGRSEEWKQNVLRNFVSVKLPFQALENGEQFLKLSVNQPGIVIDQIAVSKLNSSSYYEIPK